MAKERTPHSNSEVFKGVASKLYIEYLERSIVHGLRMIRRTEGDSYGRYIWLGIMAFVLIATHLNVYRLAVEFIESPTETRLSPKVLHVRNVLFPAIAVCSNNQISKKALNAFADELFKFQEKYHPQLAAKSAPELAEKLLAFGGLLLYPFDSYSTLNQELQNLNDLLVFKYGNGTYPTRNIIRRLAPKCEDLVKRCVLKGQNLNCSDVFFMRTTTSGVCCLFNYRRLSYTDDRELHERDEQAYNKSTKIHFDSSGYLSSLQLLLQDDPEDYTLKEYPSDVFRVFLFYPENYPDTEEGSVIRILVGYNEETEISIQPEILEGSDRMRQFSSKMRHCYFLEEGQELLKQKYYSFSECILTCRTLSVINHCGCVVPVLPGFMEGVPYCVLIDLPCIALWKSIWWQWNAFDYVSEKRQPQPTLELCNQCLPSCDVVSYDANVNSRPLIVPPNGANYTAGILNGFPPSKPTTAIRFFYQSAFSQVKTHDISGDWVVLLGRYGGICSVMYGFSIVAIIELLYFATGKWFSLWWKAIVQCYRNRKQRKVESVKHQDLYWNELQPKRAFPMRELNGFCWK